MKLLVTKNQYKQSNASLSVSDDMHRVEAYSYGWWRFVDTDAAGNVVFNSHRYSVSTGGHQRDVEGILDRLGIRVALWLSRSPRSLCGRSRDYKGYTFFLSPTGEILETHGRYNSPTPPSIVMEMNSYLQSSVAA